MNLLQLVLLDIVLNVVIWSKRLRSKRARVHWLGKHLRPRRLERPLFLLFLASMLLLELDQFIYFSVLMGGGLAIFLNLHAAYRIIPKKYHWVK